MYYDYYYFVYHDDDADCDEDVRVNVRFAVDCVSGHEFVMNVDCDVIDDLESYDDYDVDDDDHVDEGIAMMSLHRENDGGAVVAGATPLNSTPAVSHHRTSQQCHLSWFAHET